MLYLHNHHVDHLLSFTLSDLSPALSVRRSGSLSKRLADVRRDCMVSGAGNETVDISLLGKVRMPKSMGLNE